jgi:serine-type D-Ala-D-Ala carboxypeptidase/endopeptidase
MIDRRFLRLVFSVLVMTSVLNAFCVTLRADEKSLRQRIDPLVQPYLESGVFVGMSIGVLDRGQRQSFGYGRLSQEDSRVPDGDTVYEFGSASKVMTGLLLADAVVQGRVRLDQPAGELLPKGVKMPGRGKRAITLQDLSTHMSGLPRVPDNLKLTDLSNPYAAYTVKDLYSFLNGYKLTRPPGAKSEYSNVGQGLLGHLLALQAKSTYDQLLSDRIAAPLGMSSTRIKLDDRLRAKLAPGHTGDGKPTVGWDLPVLAGAGAIRSTANDLLRFADANLSPPKDKLGDAIELAWKIHQQPLPTGGSAMGLGWHVTPDGTHWHNGQTGGYHSMILINRETRTGVVLLTNSATGEVDRLASDILKMMAGAKVEPRKFEKTIKVPAKDLKKFAGRYELAPGIEFAVTAEDGKLMVSLTGQPAYEIFARSETVWYYKVVDATITFKIEKNGKCNSLELFQLGKKQTAKRLKR